MVSSAGWRVTSWPGDPRRCPLRRGSSCIVQPIHAQDLDGSSFSFSVHQSIIILYILYLYSYILRETHRPETYTPAMPERGETRRMHIPGVPRRDSARPVTSGVPASLCSHTSARLHTLHMSPTTGTLLLVRPVGAVLWARVGSQRTSVCHRRMCQVAPAARPNRLTIVSSRGLRERTAEAVNPV